MESKSSRSAQERKRRISTVVLALSLLANGAFFVKLALIDPIFPLRPYCRPSLWSGFTYLDGTTNNAFRNAATTPGFAQWLYFGFRRTDDQIYISGYDYLTKGKQDSQNEFDVIILNTHDKRLRVIEDDAEYAEYVADHPPIDRGASYDCEFTQMIAMEKDE
jgi:hypothetical protein